MYLFVISCIKMFVSSAFMHQMQIHENREKERSSLGIEAADFGEMRTPFTIAMTARAQAVDLTL